MSRVHRLTATLLLACLPAFAIAAPPPPEATPEQVATEAYTRMKAGDWEGAVETFDPKALASFRGMMQPVLEAVVKPDPSKEGAKTEAAGDMSALFLAMIFAPATSMDEIKALTDAQFLGRVMKNMTGMGGVVLESQEILGTVAEGADTVHLVARTKATAEGLSMTEMEVITLVRTPAGWRLTMSGELTGLADVLNSTLGSLPGDDESP